MKKLNEFIMKWGSTLAALALLIGVSSAESACYWWFNQPEMPEGMAKFRKER